MVLSDSEKSLLLYEPMHRSERGASVVGHTRPFQIVFLNMENLNLDFWPTFNVQSICPLRGIGIFFAPRFNRHRRLLKNLKF